MIPGDGLNIGIGMAAFIFLLGSGAFADAASRAFHNRGLKDALFPWGAVAILLFAAALGLGYWVLGRAIGPF